MDSMKTILVAAAMMMAAVGCGGEDMPTRDCDNPPPGIHNCEEAAAAAAAASKAAMEASRATACRDAGVSDACPAADAQ